MRRASVAAVVLATFVPALAAAVARPSDPRVHPSRTGALPSYVQRVEPAIVALRVEAPPDAPSSVRLGAKRFVSGVVFDARGYAVTVSYALLDARSVEATTRDNRTVDARVVGIDFESGLGVVKLGDGGDWRTAELADSADARIGEVTGTVGVDEDNDLVHVVGTLKAVRRFSASWEYMLDRALFVGPGSSSWGGSAVVDAAGRVIGIASLRLGDPPHVNLAIPAEKFLAVKDELVAAGRVVSRRPRPWLGLYTVALEGQVVVDGFAANGPARGAGFARGDRIVRVNGVDIGSQEQYYEELWRGRAGDIVRLSVLRGGRVQVIAVRSMDRAALWPRP